MDCTEKIKKIEENINKSQQIISKEQEKIKKMKAEIDSLKTLEIQGIINELNISYDELKTFLKTYQK